MTATFKNKNIYHSDLIRKAAGDKVMFKVVSKVMESKYPKPRASHVAFLKFPDDDREYSLAVENTTLADFEKAPKDVWIMAHPTGSATEEAAIWFSQAEGVPVVHTEDRAKPMTGPPPMFPDEPASVPAPAVGPMGGDAVARAVESTYRAIEGLKARGLPIAGDAVQAIYSTHYIHESKR